MRGVSWNLYDRLTDAIGERSSIRVAFDGIAADASRFLYVRDAEVTQWLLDGKTAERLSWKRRIREWARAE